MIPKTKAATTVGVKRGTIKRSTVKSVSDGALLQQVFSQAPVVDAVTKRLVKPRKTKWATFLEPTTSLEHKRLAHLHRLFAEELNLLEQHSVANLVRTHQEGGRTSVPLEVHRGLYKVALESPPHRPRYSMYAPAADPNLVEHARKLGTSEVANAAGKESQCAGEAVELLALIQTLRHLAWAHLNVALGHENAAKTNIGRPKKPRNGKALLPAPSAEPARRARGPKPEVEIDNEALIVAMNAEIESGCTMRDAARRVLGRRGLWATSGKKSGANNERRARVLAQRYSRLLDKL